MSESLLSMRFGATVRKHRSKAGLSQEALAELAHLHTNYVSMIERGIRNPTLDVADRIAKALKVCLPKLLEEAGEAP
jgi:transcriptional regulator with XRE-family HTH domain